VAIDGPLLPVPSWKLVVEVYDPDGLDRVLDWAVGEIDRLVAETGGPGLRLEREEVGGRRYYRLGLPAGGTSIDFVVVDGYLVAAPSRVLLDRALQQRSLGATLPRSSAFLSRLPQDPQVNFSAVFYQDFAASAGPFLRGIVDRLSAGEREEIERVIASDHGPTVALVYGERDRIVLVGTSEHGPLGSGLGTLLGLHGLLDVRQSLVGELARRSEPEEPAADR
jgi:hypothetical protein